MKEVSDLFVALSDKSTGYLEEQFKESHPNKNVLFINPQLSGRHFYKFILPSIVMYEYNVWSTALTSIDKYKPNKEYEHVKIPLTSREILWADYIVFPFTNIDMKDVYEDIRNINPGINIIFSVDFNYYKMTKLHPLYEKFSSEESIRSIEDNIFYSDISFVSNPNLSEFLVDKFQNELNKGRYKDEVSNTQISTFPYLLDDKIIMENIELELPELSKEEKEPLRVGIVATNYTWEDLNSYKDLLKEVQEKMGKKIKFFMIGFDGTDHKSGRSCFPKGFKIEQIKPCTIIHYFKELRNLQLDLLFIPLRKNEFNLTSENYNKFLEAGLFKVPVMVSDVFPYNEIVKNGQSGVILTKKKEFIERLEFFEKNRDELKRMGKEAHQVVMDNFVYHKDHLLKVDELFSK